MGGDHTTSRAPQHLEVETPLPHKRHIHQPEGLPISCSSSCSFSSNKFDNFDQAERSRSTRKLRDLIIFYTVVMVVEIVGGIKSNSLSVLTDAVHLLSDIAGFSISLFVVWVSGWEATKRQSFGFHRLEVLGALFSVQLIWLISGVLLYEAIERLLQQTEKVNGRLMFGVAAFGFVINVIMVLWLGHDHSHHGHSHHDHDHDHDHDIEEPTIENGEQTSFLESITPHANQNANINIQGAYLHVFTDMIQAVGVMIAGCIIWLKPNWLVVDLLCTLIFTVFSLITTLPMLKSILTILMEGAPHEIDIIGLENGIRAIKGLDDVNDLHVWAITTGKFVLSCHVVIEPGVAPPEVLQKIKHYCEQTFKIHHVTVEIQQMQ
ncbi:transporter [Lithospermum erythrorhizon]|uniref:Transporter n=1 Tax=Lithospermum erythrorhizon TaxID=34254 RepID=A0AAV3Q7W6_LITER